MFMVTHDNNVVFSGTHDDCFIYILRCQGQSFSYAISFGGYAICGEL